MGALLVIWTLISPVTPHSDSRYDWRPIGPFGSMEPCLIAANQLGLDKSRFRCIDQRTGYAYTEVKK